MPAFAIIAGLIALAVYGVGRRSSRGPLPTTGDGASPGPGVSPGPGKTVASIAGTIGSAAAKTLAAKGAAALTAATGVTAGAAAGTGAAIAGAAAIGYGITGDIGGAVGGVYGLSQTALTSPAGFITAQAGNVGREIGKALDQLLGGDGKTGTAVLYQAEGFTIAMAIASWGWMALPFLLPIAGIVAAIGAAISDNARLARGQVTAKAELINLLGDTFREEVKSALIIARGRLAGLSAPAALGIASGPVTAALVAKWPALHPDAEDEIRTASAHAAAGFAREENITKYRIHTKQAWGVTVKSWAEHFKWAEDRGVYVRPDDAEKLLADFLAYSSPAQIRPEQAQAHARSGTTRANINHYLSAMGERWGLSAVGSPATHARHWRDAVGAFTGNLDDQGNLEVPGLGWLDWNATRQSGQPHFA